MTAAPRSSNYEKFQTGNPVVRRLIDGFYARMRARVEPLGADSVLDAGCGEGETVARLGAALPELVSGVDLSPTAVAFAGERLPGLRATVGNVEALPFEEDSFDLVLCLEVLEHVPHPERAIAELARVSRRDVVVSTPDEPWFRLGSLLRGKYLRGLGNHPEHVNHWNRRTLPRQLGASLEVVSCERSLPWLIATCRVPAS